MSHWLHWVAACLFTVATLIALAIVLPPYGMLYGLAALSDWLVKKGWLRS